MTSTKIVFAELSAIHRDLDAFAEKYELGSAEDELSEAVRSLERAMKIIGGEWE